MLYDIQEVIRVSREPQHAPQSPSFRQRRRSTKRSHNTRNAGVDDIRDLILKQQHLPAPGKWPKEAKVEIVSLPEALRESKKSTNTKVDKKKVSSKRESAKKASTKKPSTKKASTTKASKQDKVSPNLDEKETPKSQKKKRIPIMTAPVENISVHRRKDDEISLVTIPKQLRKLESKRRRKKHSKSSSCKESKEESGQTSKKAKAKKQRGAESKDAAPSSKQ